MRDRIYGFLKDLKWRFLVPVAWRLGLPVKTLEEGLRLPSVFRVVESEPSDAAPEENRVPPAGSIASARAVAETYRVLRQWKDSAHAEEYVDYLCRQMPQFEADILWGRFLALVSIEGVNALAGGEALCAHFAAPRFRKSLFQVCNQLGDIRRARKLAEALADDPTMVRSRDVLRARERLLDNGYPLPAQRGRPAYVPVVRRAFYLLHNSLPYASGGYATRTHGLVTAMRARDWDVECVTRLGFPVDVVPGVKWAPPVEYIDGAPYRRLGDARNSYRQADAEQYLNLNAEAVIALARKRRPAILHGASNHINGLSAVKAGRELGVPTVYEVRGLWELTRMSREPGFENSEYYEQIVRLETQACNEADQVITITNALKNLLIDRGVDREKITVIPNGVNISRFDPVGTDHAQRRKLGFVEQSVVFGFIGSMPQYEGLDDLLTAFATLRERTNQDVRCLLVGDGDNLPQLKEQASALGVAEKVIFTGRVPHEEVAALYASCDVLVFPRKPQPVTEIVSPIKPFEAMAMEKPVIVSSVEALVEIVVHEETGLVFEKGNTASLDAAMQRLAEDTLLRARLGRAGREWVRENRDWATLVMDVESVYRNALNGM